MIVVAMPVPSIDTLTRLISQPMPDSIQTRGLYKSYPAYRLLSNRQYLRPGSPTVDECRAHQAVDSLYDQDFESKTGDSQMFQAEFAGF